MAFFLLFLLWAAVYVVAELIRPKPKFEDARPSGLGDFRFPTATEGRAVPLIWGTVKVEGPNVIWYGDLRNEAITEIVRTGMFSSDEITKGYRYILGIQFAICRAEATLTKVYVDDRVVFTGSVSTVSALSIVNLRLFGGDEFGTGGISGTLRVKNHTESVTFACECGCCGTEVGKVNVGCGDFQAPVRIRHDLIDDVHEVTIKCIHYFRSRILDRHVQSIRQSLNLESPWLN